MDSVKQHADKTPLPPDSTELGLARSDTSLTIETEYVRMLLELQDIHWLYNFMASLAAWMLLAGYLVIPGTFTSLQKSDTITNKVAQNEAEKAVLKTIQNPPLVAIAWVLLSIGVATMSFLFYRWRRNYQGENSPTLLNTAAGSRSQRTTCRFICWANGRLQILET